MGKTRTSKKKQKEAAEVPPQVVETPPVTEPPKPPVVSEEEKERAALREKCMKQLAEDEAAYNRDVLPGKLKKLTAALKKLPKKCSTEELLKAAFDALNDGDPNVAAW